MITKTEITKGFAGNTEGYVFNIYWNNRKYPNLRSAVYKTAKEAKRKLNEYLKTGKFEVYGSAEK